MRTLTTHLIAAGCGIAIGYLVLARPHAHDSPSVPGVPVKVSITKLDIPTFEKLPVVVNLEVTGHTVYDQNDNITSFDQGPPATGYHVDLVAPTGRVRLRAKQIE
ncbi:hypothetical protein [Gemmata sp.]|uniref:hypothetical protein n=1 Tax=Gemmata sp. TaxID=1914242 RepID=UPI003F6FF40B